MKIAFIVNQYPMMSEAFIATSGAALIRSGHDVHVYAFGGGVSTGSSVDPETRALLGDRHFHPAVPNGFIQHVAQGVRSMAEVVRGFGLRSVNALNPFIYRRFIKGLSSLHQVARIVAPGRYDIIHCQFATLGEYALKHKRAGFLHGKLVVHFRGYDISETIAAYGPDVYADLFEQADHFIANCEYFRARAIAIGCPPDRIDVIGSGIDLANFPYREPALPGVDGVRFVTVGRLIERKGVHVALDAMALLARDGTRFTFDIIGDGALRSDLEAQARSLGIADRVRFHGAATHAQIRETLERSHIFLATSTTGRDGGVDAIVNTVKEAMAVGVPVVGTLHGGIPELVEDGATGVLCREGDPVDLARALQRMLGMSGDWPSMAQTARGRVEREFAIRSINEKLEAVYDKVLSEARIAPGHGAGGLK